MQISVHMEEMAMAQLLLDTGADINRCSTLRYNFFGVEGTFHPRGKDNNRPGRVKSYFFSCFVVINPQYKRSSLWRDSLADI